MIKDVSLIVETVNAKVLKDIESGNGNFIKSWTSKSFQNLEGHYYSGFNVLWLHCQPFERKIYGTFLQWKAKGLKIKAGSSAVKLLLYRPIVKTEIKQDGTTEQSFFNLLKTFSVFNIEQVDGDISQWNGVDNKTNLVFDNQKAEDFINNTGAVIHYGNSQAFYRPSSDEVYMPSKDSFIDTKTASATENFYSVLLHELTHWTGAEKRLNRLKGSLFGSPEYAFEELIAELGAAYACNHLNISATPREDHAHYLKSWCKAIREHKQALLKASGCASKALQYMINLQNKKTNQIQEAA